MVLSLIRTGVGVGSNNPSLGGAPPAKQKCDPPQQLYQSRPSPLHRKHIKRPILFALFLFFLVVHEVWILNVILGGPSSCFTLTSNEPQSIELQLSSELKQYQNIQSNKPPKQNILDEETAKRIASKWDASKDTFAGGGSWHQHPLVVKTYKKRLGVGSDDMVSHLLETYGKREKCLSIGCGDGGIEVQMVQSGLCESMKGIDLSPVRVEAANHHIPDDMKTKIEFRVENAEKDTQGQDYAMVLFTHSLHHIFDLESMVTAIRDNIMAPSGILVLEEYVGPVRWQFSQHQLDLMTNFLKGVEKKHPNKVKAIRQNGLWDGNRFVSPNAKEVEKDDPSETVRSNEIVPVLSKYLSPVEDVPLGGNFFQWMFHNAYNSLTDEEGLQIVEAMLQSEMEAIKEGKITSDYVFQVWTHKDG